MAEAGMLGSGDVRSPAGHAAFSMRGTDDRWVQIQMNTFINWVNEQLRTLDMSVSDLQTDFCDGLRLCGLMEVLQGKRIGRVIRKPINQHQYLENVSLALRAMTNDNIKLVNIGSEDIVNGNLKLILAVLWHLILRYQIGRSKVPPKKLMLAWINAVLPDMAITNFSSDWNDGVALNGLMEYCRPGTCPKWRELSRKDGFTNCKQAMELAKQYFGIPLVLSPENLSGPDLDELSGMTYLSYFMKVDSPGYLATLKWVHEHIPKEKVKNFQTDWNDGRALASLVQAVGGRVPGWPNGLDLSNHEEVIEKAMQAARAVGVEPVIPAKEMADPEVDHLGVMAYAAWFQRHHHGNGIRAVAAPPAVTLATPAPAPPVELAPVVVDPPKPRTPSGEMLGVIVHKRELTVNKPATFKLDVLDDDLHRSEVKAEIVGPSGSRPKVTLTWDGSQGHCEFIPKESGQHKLIVYNDGQVVRGCPISLDARVDMSSVKLNKLNKTSYMGAPAAIQISAKDARRGAVKVEARAPSGKMHEMSVIDNNGVYTANFTPTEVGDWSVAIKYEGQHIQGSPFNVRVYDASQVKVYGLQGGTVGKNFSFSVDASGAGEGEMTVNITHDGAMVPAQIAKDPGWPGRYTVGFTPSGSGMYNIRVYFAGIEVTGSPYTLEIVDASQVTATGEGLSTVEINRRAAFVVNTGHISSTGDLKVEVTGPRGNKVPSTVTNNNNGTHTVEYVPSDVGEYVIDVLFYGRPIKGSPFKAQAFDWSRIAVRSMPANGFVGRTLEFDIDAAAAGSGNLEIMVNDGTIPCSVQNRGNRQFHASFVPKDARPHFVQMRFNGREVPGSPWRIDILSAANVTASGSGLQIVPINRAAMFEVRTGTQGVDGGTVSAVITSSTGRQVPSQVMSAGGGLYQVTYSPMEVGQHTIQVLYEGMAIPSSPFLSKVYDPNAIVVSPVPPGMIGKPVEFTIDVTQAGEGQLEIMVNRGAVPNSVRQLRKGVFMVSFVPRDPRPHIVDIKFNGELLYACPITVPIMDTSRVTVHGDGLRQVAVNKQSYFRVNTQSAGDADLAVRVTSPNGELVPAKIVQQPDGDYKVEYSSRYTGRHTVEILYAGQAIMGSPFFVEIYDPNKIRVEGTRTGMLGTRMEFDIIRNEAGRAELGLSIVGPSGRNVPYEMTPIAMGDHVIYMPVEVGPHHIHITYGGLDVPGCPIRQEILDVGSAVASGDGLVKGIENRPTTFLVDTKGRKGNLDVQVDGPNSIAKCNIDPEPSGRYVVTYIPVEVGSYNVTVKWNGREIEGSPFHPKVVDPTKVLPVGGWETLLDAQGRMHLKVHDRKTIQFETIMAGPGEMRVELQGPDGLTPVEVERRDSRYYVHFTPRMEGDYYLRVLWCGIPLPRCPLLGMARGEQAVVSVNHEKVVLTGHGLLEARVREEADFVIDGTEAGPGTPTVKLSGVKCDIDVRVLPIGANKYKCVYVPQIPGAYLLNIMWSDRQVRGSPFKVNVVQSSDASKVMASGEGLKGGIFGKEIKAVIDTRRAGPGELTAHCMGPVKVAFCELHDHHDGTFTLSIKPQEAGKHILQVKYGGEHVPGSPFLLRVAGAPDASKVRVSGPGIEHGILATYQSRFIVETRGAGAGQLTVRIRGPKGAFRVEMQRESQKDRTILCRYEPQEVGDYIISVKWSGDHVPGSPIHVQIFDTQEELERFMVENPARRHNALAVSDKRWTEDI